MTFTGVWPADLVRRALADPGSILKRYGPWNTDPYGDVPIDEIESLTAWQGRAVREVIVNEKHYRAPMDPHPFLTDALREQAECEEREGAAEPEPEKPQPSSFTEVIGPALVQVGREAMVYVLGGKEGRERVEAVWRKREQDARDRERRQRS